jgi:prophage DNA circulation protein
MDPISVATLCFNAIRLICNNVQRYRDVDESLAILVADQRELSNVVKAFEEATSRDREATAALGQRQWITLKVSLDDVAKSMKALEDILKSVQGDSSGLFPRVQRLARLEMKTDDIDALQKRIETRLRTIQLSVQFITLFVYSHSAITVVPRCVKSKRIPPNSQLNSIGPFS